MTIEDNIREIVQLNQVQKEQLLELHLLSTKLCRMMGDEAQEIVSMVVLGHGDDEEVLRRLASHRQYLEDINSRTKNYLVAFRAIVDGLESAKE